MLLAEKSSEISPKNKGYFFISESFALKWYIFKQNFLSNLGKLIEYWASAIKIFLILLFDLYQ